MRRGSNNEETEEEEEEEMEEEEAKMEEATRTPQGPEAKGKRRRKKNPWPLEMFLDGHFRARMDQRARDMRLFHCSQRRIKS